MCEGAVIGQSVGGHWSREQSRNGRRARGRQFLLVCTVPFSTLARQQLSLRESNKYDNNSFEFCLLLLNLPVRSVNRKEEKYIHIYVIPYCCCCQDQHARWTN